MLRILRMGGIIVFALFVGFSAHSLRLMHESGELYERYNGRRKSNVTLLVFSGISLGVLGYFEITRLRRVEQRRGYGQVSHRRGAGGDAAGVDTSSIYAASAGVDEWKGRWARNPSVRKKQTYTDPSALWRGFLRTLVCTLPVIYFALIIYQLLYGVDGSSGFVLWISVFSLLAFFSVVVAFGVFFLRTWGLTSGYILATLNLFIFPFGTVAGLLLLVALVGSSEDFALAEREKRRKARRRMEPLCEQA